MTDLTVNIDEKVERLHKAYSRFAEAAANKNFSEQEFSAAQKDLNLAENELRDLRYDINDLGAAPKLKEEV